MLLLAKYLVGRVSTALTQVVIIYFTLDRWRTKAIDVKALLKRLETGVAGYGKLGGNEVGGCCLGDEWEINVVEQVIPRSSLDSVDPRLKRIQQRPSQNLD